MTESERLLAAAIGLIITCCGLAGVLGFVLKASGALDRIENRLRIATRDRTVDVGDGEDFDRQIEPVMDIVADDPLPAFCCALYGTGCRHERALAAVFGEPDEEYARLLAADPASWRRWVTENGMEEIEA